MTFAETLAEIGAGVAIITALAGVVGAPIYLYVEKTAARVRHDSRNELQAAAGKLELSHKELDGKIDALSVDAVRRSELSALRTDIRQDLGDVRDALSTAINALRVTLDQVLSRNH